MARKTFIFRLQRLLDIRIMREKQAQHELQTRRAQLVHEQDRLLAIVAESAALERRMTPRTGETIDFEEIRLCAWALQKKGEEHTAQQQKILQAEQRVREQQEVVKQAGIGVKTLEKLSEKRREEFYHEELATEAAFLDDLASQQFIRRTTEAERHAGEREQEETLS